MPARRQTGTVFTPRPWARWLAERSGTVDAWLGGAAVLDPTCGDGALLLALIESALARGIAPSALPLHRLFGVEREASFLRRCVARARSEWGIDLPRERLLHADFLCDRVPLRVDRLLGNPPWCNFADLPPPEKSRLKPLFHAYGLVPDARRLLLGGSRIDVAALVIAKAVADHLRPGGRAIFFVPLSLLLNDGAHAGFRRFRVREVDYALEEIVDFGGLSVFPGVGTRYGIASFLRDRVTAYPVPCSTFDGSGWRRSWAAPASEGAALSIADSADVLPQFSEPPCVRLARPLRPRQGVNPCGASGALLFRVLGETDADRVEAECAAFGRVVLPRRFLYPLLGKEQFADPHAAPARFVLLACDEATGRPLTPEQVEAEPILRAYLTRAEPLLRGRSGRMLRGWLDRGMWWALLGVGPYCFTPGKVAWPAYGGAEFSPAVFEYWQGKPWQGYQALHAYLPCADRAEALAACAELRRPEVGEYLRSFRMAGTRSWAQPGRIARLLEGRT